MEESTTPLRNAGHPPLSFKEYRREHDGCWICYGKNLPHKHNHKTCKIYAEDKKAYFQAHPEKVPKEKRIEAWKRGQSAGGRSGGQGHGGDRRIRQIEEVADSLMRGMEALKALQNERSAPWPGDSQQDRAAVDRTERSPQGSGTADDSPPKISGIRSKKASIVAKKVPNEPNPLSSAKANPWDALSREVQVDIGSWDNKVGETTKSAVDGQDKPKIYEIRDDTLEVLMHSSVLELHAVRAVRTPHGDERQLHLKVRVMCGRKEVIADVLVDTGAQVSLVRNGLFPDTCLKSSDQPGRLKVANGGIMGGGAREAELGLHFFEHDPFDQPDQAKRLLLHGKFYEAELSDWDIIMGYDFMVSNSVGELPHRATLILKANEKLSWLSTHYAPGASQCTGDEEEKIVRAVKAAGITSKGGDGEHPQEYGLSRDAYCRMMEGLGMDTPSTDVFASKEAPKLQRCARYWHKGDSAWNKHWGAERLAICMYTEPNGIRKRS